MSNVVYGVNPRQRVLKAQRNCKGSEIHHFQCGRIVDLLSGGGGGVGRRDSLSFCRCGENDPLALLTGFCPDEIRY